MVYPDEKEKRNVNKRGTKEKYQEYCSITAHACYGFCYDNEQLCRSDQSNYGLCSGAPVSASGTAMLHYCTIVADSTVVISGPVEYDVLP